MKIHDKVRVLDIRKLRLEADFQLGLVKTCCWPRKKYPVAMKSQKHMGQR
jgi:hypothetical protein